MSKSKSHYLGKSREVLQLNDTEKLKQLLAEQRAELMSYRVDFGAIGRTKDKKQISLQRKTRKNIARILTRLNQLKQQKTRAEK